MKASTLIGILMAAGMAATVLALAATSGLAIRYKRLDDQHRACVAALNPNSTIDAERLCDPKIAAAQIAAVRAGVCDLALAIRPENTFAVRQTCSAPVKRLVADRDAALADKADLGGQLKTVRAGQAGAIARAEARVQTQAQRKIDAVAALARAPRDGDGLVVCGAQCLRDRAGVVAARR